MQFAVQSGRDWLHFASSYVDRAVATAKVYRIQHTLADRQSLPDLTRAVAIVTRLPPVPVVFKSPKVTVRSVVVLDELIWDKGVEIFDDAWSAKASVVNLVSTLPTLGP